jgi:hypothetical protein
VVGPNLDIPTCHDWFLAFPIYIMHNNFQKQIRKRIKAKHIQFYVFRFVMVEL